MMDTLIQLHKDLLVGLHGYTNISPVLDTLIYIIADKIDNYVVICAVLVLLYFVYQSIEHTRWKRLMFLLTEIIQITFAVCIAWGISYGLKLLTHLPRPYLRFPNEITQLFDYGGFDSFPSGHATLFMALAFMIYIHHKRIGVFFITCAFIISLARVISGIHFPIDIIVGWLIGGGVTTFIYAKIKHPKYIHFFVDFGKKFMNHKKTK